MSDHDGPVPPRRLEPATFLSRPACDAMKSRLDSTRFCPTAPPTAVMSFIRRKTIKGRQYLYEVENTWEDGHVRQKVLRYKGPVSPVRKPKAVEKKTDRSTA